MISMVPVNNKKKFHGIPWNWHQQIHGIPWNLECANFADTNSSMEFHGTWSVPISLTRDCSCQRNWRILSSMEFHGIPWNCSCQRNWRTQSSMELLMSSKFHGTSRVSEIGAPKVPWNSMEFHGTAHVIEISALLVPWISMEFHGTARVSEIGAF